MERNGTRTSQNVPNRIRISEGLECELGIFALLHGPNTSNRAVLEMKLLALWV